jgi:hypothetical protein
MTGSTPWTDANALAGPLGDLVQVQVTTAIGGCTACGHTAPMAEVRVFDHAPGVIARCPSCDQSWCGWSATPAGPGWTCAA